TAGTKIRFLNETELYPDPEAPHSYPKKRNSKKYMLHSEDAFFTTFQPRFTYRHGGYDSLLPDSGYGSLPALRTKLEKRGKIIIAVFGDSISAGYNASGFMGIAPQQESQHGLFAAFLREHYKTEVILRNFSEGGKTAAWGNKNILRLLNVEESPDLFILAWGMNDAGCKVRPEVFVTQIREQMFLLNGKFPNAEFMLLSSMTANENWDYVKNEYLDSYGEGLKTLAGNGVLLADVTPAWKAVVKRKGFMSLTGNGLNHPNDFGHRIYANIMINAILNNKSGVENE
ncbi:MAG: SGNH/GDSL hydrolase family protein, partial [Victivallales bacterium]